MDKVQNLLDRLHSAAASSGAYSLGSYEAPTVDNYEVEAFSHYLVSQGIDSYTAKATAIKAAATPALGAQIKQAMRASNNGQGIVGMARNQAPGNVVSAANFGLTVRRDTATLNAALPFVLFGQQDAENGYRNILGGLLPAGITLVSVEIGEKAGQANAAVFEYTDGVDTDTVTVTSATYPYPSLLAATSTDLMRMSKIRLELSDATQGAQFRQDIATVSSSPFGKRGTNSISATAFRRPDQFQAGIVDLDATFDIDKETGIISKILPVAGFEMTWNSFVEKFYRQNAIGF
jgi:hypothetical protein